MIQMAAIDIPTGHLNYTTLLDPKGDDTYIHDAVIDLSHVYLCGTTQNRLDNFDLGTIIKVEKQTGKVQTIKNLGNTSFASWTSFRKMKVLPDRMILLSRREYKWVFLFRRTSWSVLTINKNSF